MTETTRYTAIFTDTRVRRSVLIAKECKESLAHMADSASQAWQEYCNARMQQFSHGR